MSGEEDPIQSFLVRGDLSLLKKPLLFPKSREFTRCSRHVNHKWFMWLGCVPCFAPIATFHPERLSEFHTLELHEDCLKVTLPHNCCCSVTVQVTKLPLESIVDVMLVEDKFSRAYGLKQMKIWLYGDTRESGPSASLPWLARPDQAREAVLLAVSLRKNAIWPQVPWPQPDSEGRRPAAPGTPRQQPPSPQQPQQPPSPQQLPSPQQVQL